MASDKEKIVEFPDNTYARVVVIESAPQVEGSPAPIPVTVVGASVTLNVDDTNIIATQEPAAIWNVKDTEALTLLTEIKELLIQSTQPPISELVVVNTLPIGASIANTKLFAVDLFGMTTDVDATNWSPTNLAIGATVRLRKIDNSAFTVRFQDSSANYQYVDKRGEFVTLVWSGVDFLIV